MSRNSCIEHTIPGLFILASGDKFFGDWTRSTIEYSGDAAEAPPQHSRQYREDFIARIEAARLVAGMDREQVVDAVQAHGPAYQARHL